MGYKFNILSCSHSANVSNAYGHYKHTFTILESAELDSWRVLHLSIWTESVILSEVFVTLKPGITPKPHIYQYGAIMHVIVVVSN